MRFVIVTSFLSLWMASAASAATVATPAAPAEPEPQTVVGGLQERQIQVSGWFVAPTFTTSSFDRSLAYSPGIRAGIFVDRRLALGLAAHAVGNEDSYYYGEPVRNVGTYGGLLVQ